MHEGDDDVFLAFTDVLANFAFMVAALFVLNMMLPHLKAEEEAKSQGVNAGNMCLELSWPDQKDVDIDLWVKGADNKTVGYSNRSTPLMDLMRDDLGKYSDPGDKNFEIVCTRALKAGTYTVNSHFFSDRDGGSADLPVTLIVSFNAMKGVASPQPIKATGSLRQVGSEITVLDFELDKDGKVIASSLNAIYQPVRSRALSATP